jgi:hypothetical protein
MSVGVAERSMRRNSVGLRRIGLGITEGGDFSHKSSIKDRMLNLAQTPNRSRSAPLLAIPCWWQVLFFDEF